MALFNKTGLEQDSGNLADRWNQDGSTLVTASALLGAGDATLLTVTAGKVFFLKTLSYYATSAFVVTATYLKDVAVRKVDFSTPANVHAILYSVTFDAPVKFETNVIATAIAAGNYRINISGWEEDAGN